MSEKPLYERDIAAWSAQQSELLTRRAYDEADWQNIIEEIDSLGRSQRDALQSQLYRVLVHLYKLQFSPAREPRGGWMRTVREARRQIARLLRNNPSLTARLDEFIAQETPDAVHDAVADLRDYGVADNLPSTIAYDAEQILGDWLPSRT